MITFVEDAAFAFAADRILAEHERDRLMRVLLASPCAGDLIPGSGGCRKLRLGVCGRGSRGGARVIYHYDANARQILLLELYLKNQRTNLTPTEIKSLKRRL